MQHSQPCCLLEFRRKKVRAAMMSALVACTHQRRMVHLEYNENVLRTFCC